MKLKTFSGEDFELDETVMFLKKEGSVIDSDSAYELMQKQAGLDDASSVYPPEIEAELPYNLYHKKNGEFVVAQDLYDENLKDTVAISIKELSVTELLVWWRQHFIDEEIIDVIRANPVIALNVLTQEHLSEG